MIVFALVKCYVWWGRTTCQNSPRCILECCYVWPVTPEIHLTSVSFHLWLHNITSFRHYDIIISGGSRGVPLAHTPYGSRFFRFDIQIFQNIAALGVGTPLRGRRPPWEILDLLLIIYTATVYIVYAAILLFSFAK